MNIAIIGTRGIPNNHGGFEQFAEYFSVYLAKKGYNVYVYNSHNHPYQKKQYHGVKILHCYDPEYKIGTAGQFVYDYNCIKDSRKRKFDVILQLGYTSSSIWYWMMPKKALIFTNMDGMEWKRSKYSKKVQTFLKFAEKLVVRSSDFLISDSKGIQRYIKETYHKNSRYIAYGATLFEKPNSNVLTEYNVKAGEYCLIVARLEPENNIETIIKGYDASKTNYDLIIIGALNEYGLDLQKRFEHNHHIRFLGANYNQDHLNNLRHYSRYYFHGHSVGGTNPSLLEAMASNALIIANDNIFNKSILETDAVYFQTSSDITDILDRDTYFDVKESVTIRNVIKIQKYYTWEKINSEYEEFILNSIKSS